MGSYGSKAGIKRNFDRRKVVLQIYQKSSINFISSANYKNSMGSIITYETLYELLRREKTHPELQKVEKTFVQDVKKYIEDKKSILESQQSKSSIFSSKESQITSKQLENITKILKELYEKRETKVIQLALSSSRTNTQYDTSNLLEEESILYAEIKQMLSKSRISILERIFLNTPEKPKIIKTADEAFKQVKFLNSIPQFIGTDLEKYGPFEPGNKAEIPPKIAELLIREKKAEPI